MQYRIKHLNCCCCSPGLIITTDSIIPKLLVFLVDVGNIGLGLYAAVIYVLNFEAI